MTDSKYTIRKPQRPKAENPETLRINEQHKRLREEFLERDKARQEKQAAAQ